MCSSDLDQAEKLLERLAARGWVARSGRERYAMVCDKERLLVGDVYREFLDGRSRRERGENLEKLMSKIADHADETLGLPLGRLLEDAEQ